MQTIQINGTFTYYDNIKSLKIGEKIKLIKNPNNKISSEAIGAYTLDNKKIGYIPFKSNQININGNFYICKIKLNQHNPLLLINYEFNNINFIQVQPKNVRDLIVKPNNDLDIKHFKNFLIKAGNNITDINVIYNDDNFINLKIKTPEIDTIFYVVTKKYYEENVFKYDEFYNYKLIPKYIYLPFQVHRLEIYLEKHYTSLTKVARMRKFKFDNIDLFEQFNIPNFGFKITKSPELILFNKPNIDLIKLCIQYKISNNEYFNPTNYFNYNDNINIEELTNMFDDLKVNNICYNHKLKMYCDVDLYNDDNIIEISLENITKEYFVYLILKTIFCDKQIINVYNPIEGIIYSLEIPHQIIEYINELL